MPRFRALPALFAVAAFLASFQLFLIEPLQGKLLLPRFGGTPAVWNTCVVFFQALLLLGYGWSHLVATRLSPKAQVLAQAVALLAPLASMPIALPALGVDPATLSAQPLRWLLFTMVLCSGPAFFATATASPLLQSWYARLGGDGKDPYVLYAAGNLGSFAALLAYPTLVEPSLRLGAQGWLWTGGYGVLLALFACAAWLLLRRGSSAVATGAAVAAPRAAVEEAAELDEFGDEIEPQWNLGSPLATSTSLADADGASASPGEESDVLPPGMDPMDHWLFPPRSASAGTSGRERLRWVWLGALPSSLLLGVTTYMTTDIASIPLLWIVPLALYILSFAVVFWRWSALADTWARRLVPFSLTAAAFLAFVEWRSHLIWVVAAHLTAFFIACLACHGRLARTRPAPARLTEFYFLMALGGVLGGMFNTFVAPALFPTVAEYPLALAATIMAMLVARAEAARDPTQSGVRIVLGRALRTIFGIGSRPAGDPKASALTLREIVVAAAFCLGGAWVTASMATFYWDGGFDAPAAALEEWFKPETTRAALAYAVPLLLGLAFLRRPMRHGAVIAGVALAVATVDLDRNLIERKRNFYGVLTVKSWGDEGFHTLVHGGIMHGEQRVDDPEWRVVPLSYYHPDGPLGQVVSEVKTRRGGPVKLAGIGLGTGALAAYGDQDASVTFYEINPAVERMARDPELFTYLDDCKKRWCDLDVVLGDGRLRLADAEDSYDLIVVDAFNSDAIPIHLITLEALKLYVEHLTQGGIVAYHISNRYVNLEPVLLEQAKELGLGYALRTDEGNDETGEGASTWVILAADYGVYEHIVKDEAWRGLEEKPGVGLWTDDYANVAATLTWF
jgi:hypothetical protein